MSYDLSKVPKVDTSICIPKEEYASRVKELRRKMAERSIDIGILYSNPYNEILQSVLRGDLHQEVPPSLSGQFQNVSG